jgi:hypothetical protein
VGIVLAFKVRFFVLAPEALVLRMTQGENCPFCRQPSTNTARAHVLVGDSVVKRSVPSSGGRKPRRTQIRRIGADESFYP